MLLILAGVAAAGALAVLGPAWLRLRGRRRRAAGGGTVSVECPVCQHEATFQGSGLRPLTPPEAALIVGQRPQAAGRRLSEAVCPTCSACFTFYADGRRPVLLGTNIFHAQQKGNRCADCGRPLKRLPWDPRKVSTRDEVLDRMEPGFGLDCDSCGAVCCVACCEEVSRHRSTDGTLMCPRCRRGPMRTLHYF